jgi:hypothetical protein
MSAQAEIIKLAHLLGAAPEDLAYLAKGEADDLRTLRELATDRLYDADRERLERTAAASRLLPNALVATIGHKVFGALLCARLAGLLETDKAVDVAKRLPPAFLADIAVEMDPRRASEVISRLPTELVVDAATVLAERGETVTMGRFVGHLNPPTLAACVAILPAETILRSAFVLEERDRLDEIVGLMPEDRLRELVEAAVANGIEDEARDLLSALGKRQAARLEPLLSALD